jgi:two-component system, OmpR family, phosphate regulon sensor histidine kinase PhoR
MKSTNPKQIAFFVSLVTTTLFGLCIVIMERFFEVDIHYFAIFNLLILLAFVNYFIFLYFIDKFVFERIKVLYKTIQKSKRTPESLKKDNTDTVFEDVETDVLKWVVESQNQIQDLKTLEEYRRNFVGNISHELRTPIFNIQGFLSTVLDDNFEDEALTKNYVTKAARNAERLEIIVNDLETISKLENGQFAIKKQIFDIRELCNEVFEDLELLAREKNILLAFKENYSRSFKVKGDAEAIRRILDNLIKNAIKYNHEGGSVRAGFYDLDQHVLIEIADSGVGIEEKHLPFLFDRFYRIDKSRSRKDGGSGLGLSIVKHLIDAHKQTINVRSSLNKGTTFGFTLEKS